MPEVKYGATPRQRLTRQRLSSDDTFCRRNTNRTVVHLRGRIILSDTQTVTCSIQNTSVDGMKIELDEPTPMPPQFDVEICGRNSVYPCRKAWQRGRHLGVHFVAAILTGF